MKMRDNGNSDGPNARLTASKRKKLEALNRSTRNEKRSKNITKMKNDANCALTSLPSDVLRAIAVRVPAHDHDALRQTCKTLCSVLDSKEFRIDRSVTGWAEISLSLYHSHDWPDVIAARRWEVKIFVDGKLRGDAEMISVPSKRRYYFHEICDSLSEDMGITGWHFFNRFGGVRMHEIKQALRSEREPESRGQFLNIEKFRLCPEYYSHGDVGVRALRTILSHELHGMWGLVAYGPDPRPHLEDSGYGSGQPAGSSKIDAMSDDVRMKLQKKDMRLFFRAGFQQCHELALSGEGYFFFAVPSALEKETTISHEESLAIPVTDVPKYSVSSTDADHKLLRFVVDEALQRKTIGNRTELDIRDQRVRQEVARLLHEEGATFKGSHSLHLCVNECEPDFISLLLDLIPEKERLEALNGLNVFGMTPLMEIAQKIAKENDNDKCYAICEKLIHNGADTSITNACGRTALGCYWLGVRDRNDCRGILFGSFDRIERCPRIERLLMPRGGTGTPVDNTFLEGEEVNYFASFDNDWSIILI